MNTANAATVKNLFKKFVYREDRKHLWDQWFVMKENGGRYYGDCDDFTITGLWLLCDRSFWKFVWRVLVTHRYKIHRVRTASGTHVVAEVDGLWFDNWVGTMLPKDEFFKTTGHQYLKQYWSPYIASCLLVGLFYR